MSLAAIHFTLRRGDAVTVDVMDMSGRIVKRLTSGMLHARLQSLAWDGPTDRGAHAQNGVCLIRARCGTEISQAKVLLVR